MRFLRDPFPKLVEFAISLRGGVDTIAAMGGAIWGTRRGAKALPENWLSQLEGREFLEELATSLCVASL